VSILLGKFKDIESCGYECEAGKLELNIAYNELKQRVGYYEKALRKISEMPIIRGTGDLETKYNNVIILAKKTIGN
jgi:hypothetical protein